MANFTDLFIRRPILALAVSLLIFLIGLRAMMELPVRQFPQTTHRHHDPHQLSGCSG